MAFMTPSLLAGARCPTEGTIIQICHADADCHPAKSSLRGYEAIDGDYCSRAARPSQHEHGRDSTCRLFRAVAWPWNHRTMARKHRAPRPVPSTKGYAEWRTQVQAELRRHSVICNPVSCSTIRALFSCSSVSISVRDRCIFLTLCAYRFLTRATA